MVLPLNILSKESRLRKQAMFLEFKELAAIRSHPAFEAVPRPWDLPKTRNFIEDTMNIDIWNRYDIRYGVKTLASRLDEEWSDWAATRTNVFGLLLSDLFSRFMPWLEQLPAHVNAADIGVRFERYFFAEAELRHTLEFWCKANTPPPGWFHLSGKKAKVMMNPGNPVIPKAKCIPSWRYYHEMMMTDNSWLVVEAIPEGGWVYV